MPENKQEVAKEPEENKVVSSLSTIQLQAKEGRDMQLEQDAEGQYLFKINFTKLLESNFK